MVFVLDSSGSIRRDRWDIIRNFTVDVVNALIIGPVDSLVGVITFSFSATLNFNLRQYTSAATLIPALQSIPFQGFSTNTAGALQLLLASAQDGTLGLRDGRAHVAIVVTDGEPDSVRATKDAADALHAAGIFKVYAAGVGGAVLSVLNDIASNESLVFNSPQFDLETVQELSDEIVAMICEQS